MTLQELFDQTANHPTSILIFFLMIPITSFVMGAMTNEEERYESPWKYIYSTLIYFACIPGILAIAMCFYHIFFDRTSFLQLNVFTYFLPIIAMVASVFVIRQDVDLDYVPGFNRIPGLAMMIFVTFIVILLIQKTRIWVIFNGGSAMNLVFLFVGLFLLFYFGMSRFFTSNATPARKTSRKIW